jgi:type 1 glutamine amidotransferase
MSQPGVPRRGFLQCVAAAAMLPLADALTAGAAAKPLVANLICGAPTYNHDFDFARQRLLGALYDAGGIQTNVARNYDDSEGIQSGDLLVSYTSQVPVDAARCEAIRRYLEQGGRWFALHASNSVRDNKILPGLLGSRFLAHPPYTHFAVSIAKPGDALLAGIEPFDVDDELYVIEQNGDIDVLLHTRWGGRAMGQTFDEKLQPLMYRHRVGKGGVLYLALGHSAREFDRPADAAPGPATLRGPWDLPVYKELVRRGIEWAAKRREAA